MITSNQWIESNSFLYAILGGLLQLKLNIAALIKDSPVSFHPDLSYDNMHFSY